MAKHGVVVIGNDGVLTLDESSGLIGMAADAVTSVFSHQKAAVGYTKWLQLGAVGTAFNIAGVHSTTGKIGVGVFGNNFYIGG